MEFSRSSYSVMVNFLDGLLMVLSQTIMRRLHGLHEGLPKPSPHPTTASDVAKVSPACSESRPPWSKKVGARGEWKGAPSELQAGRPAV